MVDFDKLIVKYKKAEKELEKLNAENEKIERSLEKNRETNYQKMRLDMQTIVDVISKLDMKTVTLNTGIGINGNRCEDSASKRNNLCLDIRVPDRYINFIPSDGCIALPDMRTDGYITLDQAEDYIRNCNNENKQDETLRNLVYLLDNWDYCYNELQKSLENFMIESMQRGLGNAKEKHERLTKVAAPCENNNCSVNNQLLVSEILEQRTFIVFDEKRGQKRRYTAELVESNTRVPYVLQLCTGSKILMTAPYLDDIRDADAVHKAMLKLLNAYTERVEKLLSH